MEELSLAAGYKSRAFSLLSCRSIGTWAGNDIATVDGTVLALGVDCGLEATLQPQARISQLAS